MLVPSSVCTHLLYHRLGTITYWNAIVTDICPTYMYLHWMETTYSVPVAYLASVPGLPMPVNEAIYSLLMFPDTTCTY